MRPDYSTYQDGSEVVSVITENGFTVTVTGSGMSASAWDEGEAGVSIKASVDNQGETTVAYQDPHGNIHISSSVNRPS